MSNITNISVSPFVFSFLKFLGGRERERFISSVSEPVFTVACLTPMFERCARLFGVFFPQSVCSLKAISGNISSDFRITQTEMMMMTHRVLL